jgi:hypothetical protein
MLEMHVGGVVGGLGYGDFNVNFLFGLTKANL